MFPTRAGRWEVVVDVARSGINFADTHATRNDYLAEQPLPLIPGAEVSGRTADGRRVAALLGTGGYAEKVAVPEALPGPAPRRGRRRPGGGAAAAGADRDGAGPALRADRGGGDDRRRGRRRRHRHASRCSSRKRAGAKVIGLASSEEKRALVERLGADATVDSRAEDLGAAILEANGGEHVDAVLHMSGGAAFDAELAALAPLGRMVVFGIASREQREVSTAALLRGSKSVVGFWLVHLLLRRDLAAPMIGELLGAVAAGELEVTVGGVYPLSEAARAHEDLIARRTSGKLLLDPAK